MTRQALLRSSALAVTVMLAACGGGGGGGVNSTPTPPVATIPTPTPTPVPAPTPTPTPAPAPTPTPTATATDYDTTEYRATVGAVSMNALAAYQKGATGAGTNLAIIDSGIDLDSAEFGSRISSASRDVAGNASIDDQGGHGTAVAFTAAGRRNGAGTHGVAFDATLVVLRADTPGSCTAASTDDSDSGCRFNTTAIAAGVDAARNAGARVINMSLGGSAMPQNLADAIGRATAAGIIVVIAAGNDGSANVDPFAGVANNSAVAHNLVIVAGSVGTGDAISSFSDRAGDAAAHYLTAVGERVRAPDNNNTPFLWSGTSFAAPQISGAIALLAQAFPTLSGAQIVDLLYRTARDAGASGIDPVYGNGVLDLTRAFQPVGTSSLAGSKTAVSLTANATLSAPMGDARSGELGAVILDGYSRAFAIDLARTIARTGPRAMLVGALQTRTRNVAIARGGLTVAMTLAPRGNGDIALQRTTLTEPQATSARAIAGLVAQRVDPRTAVAFGFAQGSGALTAQLVGAAEPAFLVAGSGGLGFDARAASSGAIRHVVHGIGVTAAIETGGVVARDDALATGPLGYRRSGYRMATLAIDRRFGALATTVSATSLSERDTLLGARFGGGLGAARATTRFLDATARWTIGDGWTLGGSVRRGWTDARLRGGYRGTGALVTDAYTADIGKEGVFGRDGIGLRIAQPLRVASGGIDYLLPTNYDYATLSVTDWTAQRLNLAPTGREVDVEARYRVAMPAGDLQTNLFWRQNPGNFAALAADYGIALRYGVGF